MNAIRQMTYLENWLNHNVWDGEDRSGCKNDRANFNPDDLLELFTNCHEDLESELNRAQSELKRSKEISKRQGEITAINMEDFIELTDELKEANTEIDAYKFNLQGERSAVREVSDMLVSSENKLKEANAAIDKLKKLVKTSYAEGYDDSMDNASFDDDEDNDEDVCTCWIESDSKKSINRVLKESKCT